MEISPAFTFHLHHPVEAGLVCVGKCESTLDMYRRSTSETLDALAQQCRVIQRDTYQAGRRVVLHTENL